jgi:hypothetical protein
MRDRDTIDAELRLLAAVRSPIREHGGGCCSSERAATVRREPAGG